MWEVEQEPQESWRPFLWEGEVHDEKCRGQEAEKGKQLAPGMETGGGPFCATTQAGLSAQVTRVSFW